MSSAFLLRRIILLFKETGSSDFVCGTLLGSLSNEVPQYSLLFNFDNLCCLYLIICSNFDFVFFSLRSSFLFYLFLKLLQVLVHYKARSVVGDRWRWEIFFGLVVSGPLSWFIKVWMVGNLVPFLRYWRRFRKFLSLKLMVQRPHRIDKSSCFD